MPLTSLNVPLYPQRKRADCLPVCVQMVLAFHGQAPDLAWLEQILESTAFGTAGFKVLNLQHHGYTVTYAPATDERVLRQALSANVPLIALLLTQHLPYWTQETAHAVVVVGLDEENIVLNDPAFPEQAQTIALNAFMLAWSDFDYLYALIQPK